MIRFLSVLAVLCAACQTSPEHETAAVKVIGWQREPHVPTTSTAPLLHRSVRPSRSRTALPAVLVRIRSCESGPDGYATHGRAGDFDYSAHDPRSSASGAWSFLRGTWHSVTGLPGDAADYPRAVQDRAALRLWAEQGTTPWNASRACWGRS